MAIFRKGKEISNQLHKGKLIKQIYHLGKIYLLAWLKAATQQAIVAAFGAEESTQVISKTNDYLNLLAKTDPQRAQQMVDFINEDPLLVTSLVETSKTRYGYSNGDCKFGNVTVPTIHTETWLKMKPRASAYWSVFFGSWAKLGLASASENKVVLGYNGSYRSGLSYSGNAAIFEIRKNGFYIDNVLKSSYSSYPSPMPENFVLAAGNGSETYEYKCFENKVLVQDLVPCQHDNQSGILDLVNMEFHPNQGSGQFTIQLTNKV